jgi:membrane protein implicated in regulation of membrane protease activity
MLQRIAAIIITVAGVALALIIGFWVLVILGVIALVAALIYFVRTRFGHSASRHSGKIIEGEYTVVDEERKRDD